MSFLRDFEKSGIHLPDTERAKFVKLSDKIITLGRQFLQNINVMVVDYISVQPPSGLEGLHPNYIKSLTQDRNGNPTAMVSVNSPEAQTILKFVNNEYVRRSMYYASNAASQEQIAVLEDLLKTRAELASLVEKESWGHVYLEDKMAKTPGDGATKNFFFFLERREIQGKFLTQLSNLTNPMTENVRTF